jgi:hypothetical protein
MVVLAKASPNAIFGVRRVGPSLGAARSSSGVSNRSYIVG